jgi:hypothetical protein
MALPSFLTAAILLEFDQYPVTYFFSGLQKIF